MLGNRFRRFLGWPNMTMETAPKLAEALAENQRLKSENQKLKLDIIKLQTGPPTVVSVT
jgi:hypothetical protein